MDIPANRTYTLKRINTYRHYGAEPGKGEATQCVRFSGLIPTKDLICIGARYYIRCMFAIRSVACYRGGFITIEVEKSLYDYDNL